MLGAEVCSTRVFSPFRYESGDEELTVLPRHTKVIVTGNNRTKSVLVGLQGVVKKAVGLGGWHWLVLKNGVEVKLQRNALSVLEPPTGNEEDDEYDLDDTSSGSEINGKDNLRLSASNAQYSRIGKPRVRYAKPWAPSASVKTMYHSSLKDIQSSDRSAQPKLNLTRLGSGSLLKYMRTFKLTSSSPNPTREQLVDAVQHHFSSQQQVNEAKVIVEFIRSAKRLKSVDTT